MTFHHFLVFSSEKLHMGSHRHPQKSHHFILQADSCSKDLHDLITSMQRHEDNRFHRSRI